MTDAMEKQFLADIIEHPDDDGRRLIYADWLEDHAGEQQNQQQRAAFCDKAEFIRAQVALASGKEHGGVLPDDRRKALEGREQKLMQQYRKAWQKPIVDLGARTVTFRRGLPNAITISTGNFLSHGEALFDLAPIREAWLVGVTAEKITPLANSPHMENLTSLSLRGLPLGVAGARALVDSPYLKHLTSLSLYGSMFGDEGVRVLASSSHLENLTNLDLSCNNINEGGARALAESPHLKHLKQLDLSNNEIGNVGVQALAESPHLKNLKRLNLSRNQIDTDGAWALAKSPRLENLTHLDLFNAAIDDNTLREINRTMDRRRAEARQR